MILFIMAAGIAVVGVILLLNNYQELGMAMASVGVIALCVMGTTSGCAKATIGADLASVACLREAAAAVDLRSSEDVYGKVVDFNQQLAMSQWTNRQWWGDAFVPDEWDTVSSIPVKR